MSDPVKFYGAFIVSTEPIDLGKLGDNPAVTHLVNEEFELKSSKIVPGHWVIEKSVPHHYDNKGGKELRRGSGKSVSLAIIDWFDSLCSYIPYLSLERKRKLAREEEDRNSFEEDE